MAALHEDLLAIRKKSSLTQQEVYELTRIPISVIQEIENGSIFTSKSHQITYIRSYVRSYAKALRISNDDIIDSLDKQQESSYNGELSKRYLSSSATPATQRPATDKPAADVTPSDVPSADKLKPSDTPSTKKLESEYLPVPGPTSTAGANEYSRPDPNRIYNQSTPQPPKMESIDWADVGQRFGSMRSSSFLYIIVLVLILLAGGFFAYRYFASDDLTQPIVQDEVPIEFPDMLDPAEDTTLPEPPPSTTPVSPPATDTEVQAQETLTTPTRPQTRITESIPDTIFITLHAAFGKLEPVRVTSDINGLRSPYWVEVNQGMRFEFLDTITIEGQVSRMAVWVNGHHFDNLLEYTTGNRTIELTRDILSNYASMFTTEPTETPDNIEPPVAVSDRPVF
ncbi:MAG: helix-turn-helix domain-containing protein [Balneolales bacterium]|nr:helix-turn-helix domain-containing protein [Balneolales bacterium]